MSYIPNMVLGEVRWIRLFNVIFNDISVIYVTAHRCAGGMKKFDLVHDCDAFDNIAVHVYSLSSNIGIVPSSIEDL